MSCNSCTSTKTLSTCAGSLTLGTIASLSTAVYIYIKTSSGYIHRQSATSSESGVVLLDLSTPSNFYNPNGTYEVWVTLTSADRGSKQTVTIGGTGCTCFNLTFEKTYDSDGDSIEYTTQTLAIE